MAQHDDTPEFRERASVPWAALLLRLTLGGILLLHGALRLEPSLAKRAATAMSPVTEEVLGPQQTRVIVGSGEILVGLFLVVGLFVRFALLPVLIYFSANLIKMVAEGREPLVWPAGSRAEELLILISLTLILMVLGSGRLSLQSLFFSDGG